MKLKTFMLALAFIFATTTVLAADINSIEIEDQVYQVEDEVTITADVNNGENVTLTVIDPVGNQEENEMEEVEENLYEFDYTIGEDEPAEWTASINATNEETDIQAEEFFVATDEPTIKDQDESPSVLGINDTTTIEANVTHSEEDIQNTELEIYNETIEMEETGSERNIQMFETEIEAREEGINPYTVTTFDSDGNEDQMENSFNVFTDDDDVDIAVEIAPTCGSSLDLFLMPGDGEVVQNRTGTFVQIISNSGNIDSNIEVDFLDLTFEGDSPWSPGEERGESIASNPPYYDGEVFDEIRMSESVTYFELFNANYDLGNYTARSSITTDCATEGPQEQEENVTELEEDFECSGTESSEFTCFNETVYDVQTITEEVTTVNTTETADDEISEQIDEKAENTDVFTGSMNLNATDYDVYTINGTNTMNYDYACATDESGEINEDNDCAYEGSNIHNGDIEIQEIGEEGAEATFGSLEQNENMLNTTLECEEDENETAICDTTLEFFENFEPFGNFEIVDSIGEEEGDEGDEPEEGDDPDEPGETEVPEPEPEPVPEPEPDPEPEPELSVNLEALNESVETRQEQFAEVTFEVENVGNTNLTDVSIEPEQMLDDWEIEEANINSLDVGESTTREVFVQPGLDTEPGDYVVPTRAYEGEEDRELAVEYFNMEVLPADLITQLTIEETAQNIQIAVEESEDVQILLENTGEENLTNVDATLQNVEDCGITESTEVERMEEDEQDDITLTIDAGDTPETCDTTMVVSSDEGAYAFSDLEVTVVPEEALIPEEQRVPLIAILWTAALVMYAVATRKYDLDSLMVKLPYLVLIMGEIVIIMYIGITFYELPGEHLLPF